VGIIALAKKKKKNCPPPKKKKKQIKNQKQIFFPRDFRTYTGTTPAPSAIQAPITPAAAIRIDARLSEKQAARVAPAFAAVDASHDTSSATARCSSPWCASGLGLGITSEVAAPPPPPPPPPPEPPVVLLLAAPLSTLRSPWR
jgi:hypothetical protein